MDKIKKLLHAVGRYMIPELKEIERLEALFEQMNHASVARKRQELLQYYSREETLPLPHSEFDHYPVSPPEGAPRNREPTETVRTTGPSNSLVGPPQLRPNRIAQGPGTADETRFAGTVLRQSLLIPKARPYPGGVPRRHHRDL